MSKRTYKEVGGFPAYYLMEDYILVSLLHLRGFNLYKQCSPFLGHMQTVQTLIKMQHFFLLI